MEKNARGTRQQKLNMPRVSCTPVFTSQKQMKEDLRTQMKEQPYDVADFYFKEGCCRAIATNHVFERVTLAVTSLNVVWIAIDTEFNHEDILYDADTIFIFMENLFCAFFAFEWTVRFGAFANKLNCIQDGWFVFDSCMLVIMVLETWVLLIVVAFGRSTHSIGQVGLLTILRLLRLSRIARMAKLLRSMPELLILLKGIFAALRTMCFTLWLLLMTLFVFALTFRQLTDDTPFGREHLPTILRAAHYLLVRGVFLDAVSITAKTISHDVEENEYLLLFLLYLLIVFSAVLLINMLIGVLCEVVSAVAAQEHEGLEIRYVMTKLENVLRHYGFLEQPMDTMTLKIDKAMFVKLLTVPETAHILDDADVDVLSLINLVDTIFLDDDAEFDLDSDERIHIKEKILTFPELIDVLLEHRKSKKASVNDVTILRKYISLATHGVHRHIDVIAAKEIEADLLIQTKLVALGELFEKAVRAEAGSFKSQVSHTAAKVAEETPSARVRKKKKKIDKDPKKDSQAWASNTNGAKKSMTPVSSDDGKLCESPPPLR